MDSVILHHHDLPIGRIGPNQPPPRRNTPPGGAIVAHPRLGPHPLNPSTFQWSTGAAHMSRGSHYLNRTGSAMPDRMPGPTSTVRRSPSNVRRPPSNVRLPPPITTIIPRNAPKPWGLEDCGRWQRSPSPHEHAGKLRLAASADHLAAIQAAADRIERAEHIPIARLQPVRATCGHKHQSDRQRFGDRPHLPRTCGPRRSRGAARSAGRQHTVAVRQSGTQRVRQSGSQCR
jgi:hypothetical protein